MTDQPIWSPTAGRIAGSQLSRFIGAARENGYDGPDSYRDFHLWSVERPEAFWSLLWDFCGVVGEKGERVLVNGDQMPGAAFFPDAKLNFAENLLKLTGGDDAIVFRGEDKVAQRMSWDELRSAVSSMQQLFASVGVKPGDRVAAMLPNLPETIVSMLAAASVGAVFTSCSPDFGEQGVLDRFGQVEPIIFVGCDGYWYNGKQNDTSAKVANIAARLPSVRQVIVVDYLGGAQAAAEGIPEALTFDDAVTRFTADRLRFESLPFSHPLYILYSSGTTGVPKCLVHTAGGTLLQHLKEHRLHSDMREGDRFFYFTTCSWMMWNWLASGLASGATLLLYDGSPFYPDGNVLFDYAQAERMTHFGTSAKFIDALRKSELRPARSHNLGSLRTVLSTGSPLSPDGFRYVYDSIGDVHLASMSGGTDIVSCFVLGVPTEPVRIGEIQGPGLGMAVDVWDDEGRSLRKNKGELVCAKPFPSMPAGFWNDTGGHKYRSAYFDRFTNIWCHGDFAEWTEHGGMIIHGRSDAVLNPGGVRIGTAEIYNQVEQIEEVVEAICIGQSFDDDVRVVLFVKLRPGATLDDALERRIRTQIRAGTTPRHVPAKIISVADIPRTKSGKIVEIAVRDVVHGREINNFESLANPEALDYFRNIPSLAV